MDFHVLSDILCNMYIVNSIMHFRDPVDRYDLANKFSNRNSVVAHFDLHENRHSLGLTQFLNELSFDGRWSQKHLFSAKKGTTQKTATQTRVQLDMNTAVFKTRSLAVQLCVKFLSQQV